MKRHLLCGAGVLVFVLSACSPLGGTSYSDVGLLPGEQKVLAEYIARCPEESGVKLLFDPADRIVRIYPDTVSEEWKKRCQSPFESIFEDYPLKAVDADYLRSAYDYVPPTITAPVVSEEEKERIKERVPKNGCYPGQVDDVQWDTTETRLEVRIVVWPPEDFDGKDPLSFIAEDIRQVIEEVKSEGIPVSFKRSLACPNRNPGELVWGDHAPPGGGYF